MMRGFQRSLICAALAMASPIPASVRAQAMSDEETTAVQLALDRGQVIYAYDQAAWHGTDDLQAKAQEAGIWEDIVSRGGAYVVHGPPGEPEFVFFENSDDPRAIFVARFTADGTRLVDSRFVTSDEPTPITPEVRRMIEAQRAAYDAIAETDSKLCADALPNIVVLPPRSPSDPVLVYFLTPQIEADSFPFGGHFLVEVMPGGAAGEIRPFTRSCLTMDLTENRPRALTVTHLLDPTPTEIHVFTMFAARLPVYVMTTTNNRLWVVESSNGQARIRTVETPED